MLFGDPEPAGLRDKCEVVQYAEGLLTDADAYMGTHYCRKGQRLPKAMLQGCFFRVFVGELMCDRQFWLLQYYSEQHSSTFEDPQATTSPAARSCEGSRSCVTGLTYLRELVRRQVWSGER